MESRRRCQQLRLAHFVNQTGLKVPTDVLSLIDKYVHFIDSTLLGVHYFDKCVEIYGLFMEPQLLGFICDFNKKWSYYGDDNCNQCFLEDIDYNHVLKFWPSYGLIQYLNCNELKLDLVQASHSASNWCVGVDNFMKYNQVNFQIDIINGFNTSHANKKFIRDEFRLMLIGHEKNDLDVCSYIANKSHYETYGLGYFDGLSGPFVGELSDSITNCAGISVYGSDDGVKCAFVNVWNDYSDVIPVQINALSQGDQLFVQMRKVFIENGAFMQITFGIKQFGNDVLICGENNLFLINNNHLVFGMQCTRCDCVGDSLVCRVLMCGQ